MLFVNDYIKSDLIRYVGKEKLNFKNFVIQYKQNSSFRYQVAFRLIQSKGIARFVGYILWLLRDKERIQLPRQTKVGYGLYIGHGGPVIVNPTAKIGNNVNLSQFTTIGSNRGKAATIGDNVYIAANSVVIGDIKIGNNTIIGAGSVVTKSLEGNSVYVGNPARFIKNINDEKNLLGMILKV